MNLQDCIARCTECHRVCLETIAHCLGKGGRHAEAGHIRMLQDCAQICATSADFMIRGSELHHWTCGVCAEVCDQCADDCERMNDDAQMQRCIDFCRRCAQSCREMAQARLAETVA